MSAFSLSKSLLFLPLYSLPLHNIILFPLVFFSYPSSYLPLLLFTISLSLSPIPHHLFMLPFRPLLTFPVSILYLTSHLNLPIFVTNSHYISFSHFAYFSLFPFYLCLVCLPVVLSISLPS